MRARGAAVGAVPPEALLATCPASMREIAEALRTIVRRAAPEAAESVRPGWRLIGYDLPVGPRRRVYFCFILPEPGHVHLGFPWGVLMRDPAGLLLGAGVTRRARWVTLRHGDPIRAVQLAGLVKEGARIAPTPHPARLASLLDPPVRLGGSRTNPAGPVSG